MVQLLPAGKVSRQYLGKKLYSKKRSVKTANYSVSASVIMWVAMAACTSSRLFVPSIFK